MASITWCANSLMTYQSLANEWSISSNIEQLKPRDICVEKNKEIFKWNILAKKGSIVAIKNSTVNEWSNLSNIEQW